MIQDQSDRLHFAVRLWQNSSQNPLQEMMIQEDQAEEAKPAVTMYRQPQMFRYQMPNLRNLKALGHSGLLVAILLAFRTYSVFNLGGVLDSSYDAQSVAVHNFPSPGIGHRTALLKVVDGNGQGGEGGSVMMMTGPSLSMRAVLPKFSLKKKKISLW